MLATHASTAAATLPPALPRRVTYVVPPPTSPPPLLSLPPLGIDRKGRTAPIYSQRSAPPGFNHAKFIQEHTAPHPKHRLAVQALALDLSTSVSTKAETDAPGGILYTGARDGLLCSWELGLPMRRRKRRYGRPTVDTDDDEDENDDGPSSDEEIGGAATDPLELDDLDGLTQSTSVDRTSPGARNRARSHSARRGSTASHATTKGARSYAAAQADALSLEERWEVDDERVKNGAPDARFRQCIQSHTDWINDIVLCNNNQTLVSASSDSLILAWSPHASNHHDQVTPSQIGKHNDYVRCLTTARDAGWVASGGFDRKVKLWDVGEGRSRSILDLSAPASVYSLASTTSGSLLAAGTPERVVRVWDPRSRSQVARLGGHTDNVRAVLLGEEGKWLLSASSDSTVKLWSLSAQKCLHTFSHHSESVWSLFSQHPSLEIFYSGDRVGNVCKIDLQGTGDPGEGECILLARDSSDDNADARLGCQGVTQLIASDDSFVWTAGGSSVKRWRDVAPRIVRAGAISTRPRYERDGMASTLSLSALVDASELPARSTTPPRPESPPDSRERSALPSVSFLEGLTTGLSRTTSSPSPHALNIGVTQPNVHRPSSLRTRVVPTTAAAARPSFVGALTSSTGATLGAVASNTLYDIPYDSLVPLTSPEDSYFSPAFLNRARDPDAATIYSSASVTSFPTFGLASRAVASTSPLSYQRPRSNSEMTHEINVARREYIERNGCGEAVPLRTDPDSVIQGGHGLMRCELLNDRRHVLTLDTEDEVSLWDIVRGECLGVFEPQELHELARRPSDAVSTVSGSGSSASDLITSGDLLDFVRERIEGEASIATWCKCDARVGSLVVHLEEARVFDGEVYADESVHGPEFNFGPDHRLSLGKWVLRNLFDSFIEAEMELRTGGGTPVPRSRSEARAPNFISLSGLASPMSVGSPALKTPGMTIALATPAINKAVVPTSVTSPSTTSPRSSARDLDPIPQSPTPHVFDAASFARSGTGSATPGGVKTPTMTGRGEGDYFSLPAASSESAPPASAAPAGSHPIPLPTPGGTLMGRLRNFGKNSRKSTLDTSEAALPASGVTEPVEAQETRTVEEQQQHNILQSVFSRSISPCTSQDAPTLAYRPDMAVIISEETADSSAWSVTYRGLVGTGREDLGVLEQKAPLWLLDFLLGNRIPFKEPVKLSFLIQPWRDEDGATSLAELPNSNARLTANRTLRICKVMGYVAEKLQLGAAPSRAASISSFGDLVNSPQSNTAMASAHREPSPFDAERNLEILVAGAVMPMHVTIASARAFYWKQGGDLVLHYRMK